MDTMLTLIVQFNESVWMAESDNNTSMAGSLRASVNGMQCVIIYHIAVIVRPVIFF